MTRIAPRGTSQVERDEAGTTFYVKVAARSANSSRSPHPSSHRWLLPEASSPHCRPRHVDLRERAFALLICRSAPGGRLDASTLAAPSACALCRPVASVGYLVSLHGRSPGPSPSTARMSSSTRSGFFLRKKFESTQFLICISDYARSQALRVAPVSSVMHRRRSLGVDCTALQASFPTVSRPTALRTTAPVRIVCTAGSLRQRSPHPHRGSRAVGPQASRCTPSL